MFEIRKEASFEASHRIEGHKDYVTGEPGKCSRLHGHSYKIAIAVKSDSLKEIGFVVDYYLLGKVLKDFCDMFDHQNLNDFECFTTPNNATAELIAKHLYEFAETSLRAALPKDFRKGKVDLSYAECSETDSSSARYTR